MFTDDFLFMLIMAVLVIAIIYAVYSVMTNTMSIAIGGGVVVICLSGLGLMNFYSATDKPTPGEISQAKQLTSCRMIEENINNGFLSENTNKLDCGGVIRNVSVSDYQHALDILSVGKD